MKGLIRAGPRSPAVRYGAPSMVKIALVERSRSLRKTAAHVHATYGGTFTNNLSGDNFRLRINRDSITDRDNITLSIDLSRNLRTHNKETNSYLDAVDLAERHSTLEFIQLDDKQVLDGLASEWERAEDPTLYLSMGFGDRGTFTYRVEIEPISGGGGSVRLNVLESLGG